jgi:hypothetical protein
LRSSPAERSSSNVPNLSVCEDVPTSAIGVRLLEGPYPLEPRGL